MPRESRALTAPVVRTKSSNGSGPAVAMLSFSGPASETTRRRLAEITAPRRWQSTWIVAPDELGLELFHIEGPRNCEIALKAPNNWILPSGRAALSRELPRVISAGREYGITITTLAVEGAIPSDRLDILVKHGVQVVDRLDDAPAVGEGARLLRHGLYELPSAIRLAGDGLWLWRRRAVRRTLESAVASGGMWRLAVHFSGQEGEERRTLARLEGLLARLAENEAAGAVTVSTPRRWAEAIAAARVPHRARSILRAA